MTTASLSVIYLNQLSFLNLKKTAAKDMHAQKINDGHETLQPLSPLLVVKLIFLPKLLHQLRFTKLRL